MNTHMMETKTPIHKEKMIMSTIKTGLKFDVERPEVDCYLGIFIPKIWNRLKFACQIVMGATMDFMCTHTFNNTNDIRDAISVLRKHIPKETKVFSMQKAFPEAILPTKAHESDVGWDLATPIDFRLNPGETRRIDFGIIVDIPDGYYIQVHNRSSVVWKYNTMMALGTGTVDTQYRGAILCPFYNFGQEQVQFNRGDRLAQMVIRPVVDAILEEGDVNTDTERGDGAYGSTGR
jgi:dUTP pyrophosphatase